MILLVWLYMVVTNILHDVQRNNQLVSLRNDEHSITQVLDRFVLPRQLSEGQIKSIGSFLQNFQPQEVSFELVQGDQEANVYQNDLQHALEKAGWHIKEVKSVPETSQSLSIDFRQTPEHSQVQSDFKHPKGDLLLQEAFGLAGVRLDGVSSGSDLPPFFAHGIIRHSPTPGLPPSSLQQSPAASDIPNCCAGALRCTPSATP
jgi:hypothetical protein